MKLKKLLSVVVSLALLLTVISVPMFATAETPEILEFSKIPVNYHTNDSTEEPIENPFTVTTPTMGIEGTCLTLDLDGINPSAEYDYDVPVYTVNAGETVEINVSAFISDDWGIFGGDISYDDYDTCVKIYNDNDPIDEWEFYNLEWDVGYDSENPAVTLFETNEDDTIKLFLTAQEAGNAELIIHNSEYVSEVYATPLLIKVVDNRVAKIGNVKYDTLEAALTVANGMDGATVELLRDTTLNTGSAASSRFAIQKSMTINGNGFTISVNNRGFGVGMNATSNIDVTFKDVTITNSTNAGRCIDTRGHINSLTLDNVVLATTGTSGYLQPLTIGGNQATVAEINVINSTIKTSEDGSKGYAIITFNPVDMTVTGSTIKGWACFYVKSPDSSAGSAGSTFTATDSTLVSKNPNSGSTNAFGTIVIEDADIDFNISDCDISIDGSANDQYLITYNHAYCSRGSGIVGCESLLGEGNNVNLRALGDYAYGADSDNTIKIIGGTFNKEVPAAYVADGYEAVDNGNGTWTVVSSYAAQIGNVKYATVAEAVAAAQDGDVIEVIADTTEDLNYANTSNYLKNKTVTLTGNKTITGASGNYTLYFGDFDNGNRATTDTLNMSNLTFNKTAGAYAVLFDGVSTNMTDVTINAEATSGLSFANGSQAVLENVTVANTGSYAISNQQWRNNALSVQGIGTGPSVLTVKSGTYTSANGYAVYIYSSGGTVNIEGGNFSGKLIAQIDRKTYHGDDNISTINISGGNFTNCDLIESGAADYANIIVTGGTFDIDPTDYVADGYEAVNNGNETWTVGKVKAGELAPTETNAGYNATYTVTKQVVDADNHAIEGGTGTERTVNVRAVTENTASENTADEIIGNLDMNKVLDSVVASVSDTADTVNVDIKVVRSELEVVNDTITYEVHPEATVYVNNQVAASNVEISNDALEENAVFKITLPVPPALAENDYVKVIHRSTGYADDVQLYPVKKDNGNYVELDVTHFSEFIISENDLPLFAGYSVSLNGYIDLNFYLNLAEEQVTSGEGTVVNFSWDRGEGSYQVQTSDYVSGRGYKATVRVPAAEMSDMITASVKIDNHDAGSDQYSVRDYGLAVLNDPSSSANLKKLVTTMLEYGAKAQVAFGRTDNVDLANKGIYEIEGISDYDYRNVPVTESDIDDAIHAANNEDYASDMESIMSSVGAEWYTPSLIYLSGCTLRQYFVSDWLSADGFNGVKDTDNPLYKAYYLEKTDIAAADLDKLQEFQIGEITFKYSALDYVKAIICNYNESDPGYQLAAATYWYNQAANAYFPNN